MDQWTKPSFFHLDKVEFTANASYGEPTQLLIQYKLRLYLT